MSKDRKLYRSRSNKILCSVLGGLGDYFNVDPTVLRVAYVLLSVFVLGSPIILYIICALIIPQEPEFPQQQPPYQQADYQPCDNNKNN